ncbi:MAG: tyrosine-type recombinase/integrase [Fimbriimonadaceae bacterium]|nr:MAG: tyrosine-type recombinase/integrase [Fimbriimonadaceae bacterium]
MAKGRPKKENKFIPREIQVTLTYPTEKKVVSARSNRAADLLIRDAIRENGEVIPSKYVIYWELRKELPYSVYDPNLCEWRTFYKTFTFKARTQEECLIRAERKRMQHLNGVANSANYVSHDLRFEDRQLVSPRIQERRDRDSQIEFLDSLPTISQLIENSIAAKLERGQIKATYAETSRSYLRTYINQSTSPSADQERYVEPFVFGDLRIHEVTRALLQEFIDSLARKKTKYERPLSSATIRKIVQTIQAAWNTLELNEEQARFHEQLRFEEKFLSLPKEKLVRPNTAYTESEIRKLLQSCEDEVDRAFLAVCLMGVRAPGEVSGLRWSDIVKEEDGYWMNISHQIQIIDGERVLTDVKTGDKGIRKLAIPDQMVDWITGTQALAKFRQSDFVIPGVGGSGLAWGSESPKALQRRFERLKKRAGINRKGSTLYALRHTVTSEIASLGGLDLAVVAGGWANSATFRKNYDQRNMAKPQRQVANQMSFLPAIEASASL